MLKLRLPYSDKISLLISILLAIVLINNKDLYSQNNRVDLTDEFNNYIELYYKIKNVPSISAGVLKNDSLIWLGSRGFTDIENSVSATSSSIYRIASISKPITAVAIMQLWEKGILNLDDDVRKHVPYFPKKKWVFTIRQLLNHTSGIRSYRENEFHSKVFYSSTREALKVFDKDSLLFKPGSDYLYSTFGYTLLAAVIESASRKPFAVYVKENILIPSGMYSTFVDVQKEIIKFRARGYIKNYYRELENSQLADLSIKVAGGGYMSTANDLLLFAKNLLNGNLLNPATLDSMIVPTRISRDFIKNYGLGFSLPENRSDRKFYHAGAGTGFTSKLLIDPVEKIAVVHLINLSDRNLENPADELMNIFKKQSFRLPGYNLSDTLMSYYRFGGLDSVFAKLTDILNNDSSGFYIEPDDIAGFGRDLLHQKNNLDAIDYLKQSNRLFPNSFTLLVALADIYNSDGNKGLALRNYKSANLIDKQDRYVKTMIRRLSQ
ncbi:MAG: serine hydrolase domain-containing protein [Ignavibacteriaceae bacterium]